MNLAIDIGQVLAAALYTLFAIQLWVSANRTSARCLLSIVSFIQAGFIMGLTVIADWEHAGRVTFLTVVVFLLLLNWATYERLHRHKGRRQDD